MRKNHIERMKKVGSRRSDFTFEDKWTSLLWSEEELVLKS